MFQRSTGVFWAQGFLGEMRSETGPHCRLGTFTRKSLATQMYFIAHNGRGLPVYLRPDFIPLVVLSDTQAEVLESVYTVAPGLATVGIDPARLPRYLSIRSLQDAVV